jgi:predicted phosphodiesterase
MSRRLHTTLILPDVHVPFHNARLMGKVLKLARDIRPDQVVILGDFLDLYSISSHNKGSLERLSKMKLSDEYKAGWKLMEQVNASCGSASQKDYIYGNHEDRFNRYKSDGDNAKTGDALERPEEALRLAENDWDVHLNWMEDSVKIGNHLELMHGFNTCKHAAAKHLEDVEGSVVFSHTHRFQIYATGKHMAVNLGFLGDRDSEGFSYMPRKDRRKWMNSFGVNYTLDDGSFRMCPVQCWADQFVFGGRLY